MARAIIRLSINGESDNNTNNAVRATLQDEGFIRIGTNSYEISGASFDDIADCVIAAFGILKKMPGGGSVDHVWSYVDRSDE
jgi:hypothetical protein